MGDAEEIGVFVRKPSLEPLVGQFWIGAKHFSKPMAVGTTSQYHLSPLVTQRIGYAALRSVPDPFSGGASNGRIRVMQHQASLILRDFPACATPAHVFGVAFQLSKHLC